MLESPSMDRIQPVYTSSVVNKQVEQLVYLFWGFVLFWSSIVFESDFERLLRTQIGYENQQRDEVTHE